jgi:hypothetical protein
MALVVEKELDLAVSFQPCYGINGNALFHLSYLRTFPLRMDEARLYR